MHAKRELIWICLKELKSLLNSQVWFKGIAIAHLQNLQLRLLNFNLSLELIVDFELVVVHPGKLILCELHFLWERVVENLAKILTAAIYTLHLPMKIYIVIYIHLHVNFFKSILLNLNHIVATIFHALNAWFVILCIAFAYYIKYGLFFQSRLSPALRIMSRLIEQ